MQIILTSIAIYLFKIVWEMYEGKPGAVLDKISYMCYLLRLIGCLPLISALTIEAKQSDGIGIGLTMLF